MGVVYEYFTYNKTSSRDFLVWISGSGTFDAPERDIESISIPGRNGDLHIDNHRFHNIPITYPAFITEDFQKNYNAFKAFMLSQKGYNRLEDSYSPDIYRLAQFKGAINPQMAPLNRAGSFDIVFDCDPRRFYKSGEETVPFTAAGQIKNPSLYDALPLLRAYGTGSFTVNGTSIQVTSANSYTDIDCESQEAYKGSTNCNNNIVLTNGTFPTLKSDLNNISLSGISRLEIIPRWWTV